MARALVGLILGAIILALPGCASVPAPGAPWPPRLWCAGGSERRAEARANAASLASEPINLFGRDEAGWAVYVPAIQAEIGSACPADGPGFARALARWQARQTLPATGLADPASLARLKALWQARRPFMALRAQGICPDPPAETALEAARADETVEGKAVRLRPDALAAYRAMVAAARDQVPALAADPGALKLFSGYRSPEADSARCAADGDCQGLTRAACSSHRTGLALDLVVGAAPGFHFDSSTDANRLFQSRGPAYLWLTRNARHFGFVNYVFEPWHWEWTGTVH